MSDKEKIKEFGSRVRELRELHALTQKELAEKAHLNRTTIVNAERGQRVPFPSTRRKLAQSLGVSVEELWRN